MKPQVQSKPVQPIPFLPTQAIGIVRRDSKWHILLLSLSGDRVVSADVVTTTYHRDLAEDEARRLARTLGR